MWHIQIGLTDLWERAWHEGVTSFKSWLLSHNRPWVQLLLEPLSMSETNTHTYTSNHDFQIHTQHKVGRETYWVGVAHSGDVFCRGSVLHGKDSLVDQFSCNLTTTTTITTTTWCEVCVYVCTRMYVIRMYLSVYVCVCVCMWLTDPTMWTPRMRSVVESLRTFTIPSVSATHTHTNIPSVSATHKQL